jgi:hypothetical protein
MKRRPSSMDRLLRRCAGVLLVCLGLCQMAWAETATVEVRYLPLQEAADLVKSQLSSEGKVAQLPSRRLLVIQDDAQHIKEAKAILKRLDVAVPQLSVQVDIDQEERVSKGGAKLSGGWVQLKAKPNGDRTDFIQLQAGAGTLQNGQKRHFSLYLASGKQGHIDAGEVQVAQPEVRQTLTRYGIEDTPDLAFVPITAGFDVQVTLIDDQHARLQIRPWFRRMEQKTDIQAKMEVLPDLGSTSAPQQPPSTSAPMRDNITPAVPKKEHYVWLADAETELVVRLGHPVELAAVSGAAHAFSQTLLSSGFNTSEQTVRFRVQVNKAQ